MFLMYSELTNELPGAGNEQGVIWKSFCGKFSEDQRFKGLKGISFYSTCNQGCGGV